MNTSFWLYLTLLATPTTLLANDDEYDQERLYAIEVFNKNETNKNKKGLVLLASSYATWQDLKSQMQNKFHIELENRIVCILYKKYPYQERTMYPQKGNDTLYDILEQGETKNKVFWQYTWKFDTLDYKAMTRHHMYKLAKWRIKQLKKIPESEKQRRSVLAEYDNTFQLMSIDDYHQMRKNNLKTRKKTLKRVKTPYPREIHRSIIKMSRIMTQYDLKEALGNDYEHYKRETNIQIRDEKGMDDGNNTNTDNDGKEDSHGETYSDNEDNNNSNSDSNNNRNNDSDSNNNSNNDNDNENNDNTPPTNFLSKETQIGIAVVIIPAGIILQNVFFTHLKKQPKKTRPKKHTDTTDQSI